jgi:hypothetical protein
VSHHAPSVTMPRLQLSIMSCNSLVALDPADYDFKISRHQHKTLPQVQLKDIKDAIAANSMGMPVPQTKEVNVMKQVS